jgi:4-alpha-glucanotransferase
MGLPHFSFGYPNSYDDALRRAADACSIDLAYWDIFHRQHHISADGLRSILSSQGWDVSSQEAIQSELLRRFESSLRQAARHTCVISESDKSIELTLPMDAGGHLNLEIHLENGSSLSPGLEAAALQGLRELSSPAFGARVYRLPLPPELPLGYHHLDLTLDGVSLAKINVIVCPDRAYIPERLASGGKTAGLNVTLYGLRSDRNWGCGDFTDLKALIEWAHAEMGFSFIGLNPLHALHNRVPYNTSPYLPLSVYYKNHIYIDVERVPEFVESRWARELRASSRIDARIQAAREAEFVAYHDVDVLKRGFLKVLYREFKRSAGESRAQAFREFCGREGDLLDKYALYRALDEVLHKQDRNRWTWRDWPAEYHDPESDACRGFAGAHARTIEYYKYSQFVLEEQLTEVQSHAKAVGMSVGLYHDLAVATDSCGSDLWAHRKFYVNGCRVGAPPDDFSPKGQDWGFPPPNGHAHSEDGYRLYRESIRKIVRTGGALRLDHVMRLFRLFWIPAGMEAAQGTYVRDNATDLMRILALESVRSQNIIIGEDLGTVTDEIRDMLARFRILSYRLFYFERNRDGYFKPSAHYPQQALVSSSTHDLATLAGFWTYRDIEARRAAGLADEHGYWEQRNNRNVEKQRMLDTLHQEGLVPPYFERDAAKIPDLNGDLHNGVIGFLAQVPSMILLLNQEDLTKETEQQNLPGSTAEYPNWQRKMRVRIEDLRGPAMAPYLAMARHQLERTGRLG